MKIIIIGAGLTGLSIAYHLEKNGFRDYEIFEKEDEPGGLIRTEEKNGFLFDYSGHFLHLNNAYTKKLLSKFLTEKFKFHKRNAGVFLDNKVTPYPFQSNLHNVSLDIVKECLVGFAGKFGTVPKKTGTVPNFYDWVLKNFGEGFAKYFFVPYNTKLFKTDAKELTSDWAKRFIPVPDLNAVIKGLFKSNIDDSGVGYSSSFYYPKAGGMSVLKDFFLKSIKKINLSTKIKEINLEKKYLVSTIPMPELIKSLSQVPSGIVLAANKLRYTSVLNLNLGLSGKPTLERHWVYFPEKDKIFYRVGITSNVSNKVVPLGCSSLSVEIAYNRNKKIDKNKLIKKAIEQLVQIGFIKSKKNILVEFPLDIEYAYVIFNHQREHAIKTIMDFLNKNKILTAGRYGNWGYSSMEDAILEGKVIAERILSNHEDKILKL